MFGDNLSLRFELQRDMKLLLDAHATNVRIPPKLQIAAQVLPGQSRPSCHPQRSTAGSPFKTHDMASCIGSFGPKLLLGEI